MKYTYFSLALLFCLNTAFAQSNKNAIKVGVAIGISPYEEAAAPGVGIQLDRRIVGPLSFSLAAGQMQATVSNDDYATKNKDKFSHLDASFLYSLGKKDGRSDFKLGAGVSFTRTDFHYTPLITVTGGGATHQDYIDHKVDVVMANFLAEYDVHISDHLIAYGRAAFRSAFSEKSVVDRTLQFDDNSTSITSNGIVSNFSLTLGIGYSF